MLECFDREMPNKSSALSCFIACHSLLVIDTSFSTKHRQIRSAQIWTGCFAKTMSQVPIYAALTAEDNDNSHSLKECLLIGQSQRTGSPVTETAFHLSNALGSLSMAPRLKRVLAERLEKLLLLLNLRLHRDISNYAPRALTGLLSSGIPHSI